MSKDKKHILVGEDDPGITEVVSIILNDAGYIPHMASSEKEIEDHLHSYPIAMIFLDVLLRNDSGKNIAKKIKSSSKTSHIPLIMLSANMEIQQITEEVKADGYLQKPFDIDEFLSTVTKHIRK